MVTNQSKPIAYKGDQPFIFVSYAHSDREEVYPDLLYLSQQGYRVWYDEGIRLGREWPAEIQRAIEACAFFITFLSPDAVGSDDVRNEINVAVEERKQFLAIHIKETQLAHGLKVQIGAKQALRKYELSREDYLRYLGNALSEDLRSSPDIYPLGSKEDDFAREIELRIKKARSWSAGVTKDLMNFAELLDLDPETGQKVLDKTLKRLGIDEDYGARVEKFRQLVLHYLELGEIVPERRRTLSNRAGDWGLSPEHWESIIQEEAVSRAESLAQQGDIPAARRLLESSVGQFAPQSREVLGLLDQLETKPTPASSPVGVRPPPSTQETKPTPVSSPVPATQPETPPLPSPDLAPIVADRAITAISDQVVIHWVRIPAGAFVRGCPEAFIRKMEDEWGKQTVAVLHTFRERKESLDEFWISLTEITNAQYHTFVKATGHRYPVGWRGMSPPYPREAGTDTPVTGVTWQDSFDFAEWLGARLPSRAEYEKACRGENGLLYPWGDVFDQSRCNTAESNLNRVTQVEAFPQGASPYGVLDLVGNVWEWSADGEDGLKMTVGASYEQIGEVYGAGFFDVSRPPEPGDRDLGFRLACSDLNRLLVKKLEFESDRPAGGEPNPRS